MYVSSNISEELGNNFENNSFKKQISSNSELLSNDSLFGGQ